MRNSLFIFLFLLLSVRGFSQSCTLTVTISSSSPAICSGNSAVLTATASAGTAPYTYVWNTGETTPTISVNKAATYTVTVSDKTPGCQPVKQSITITASTIPDAPTVSGTTVCQNSSATLTATAPGGTYQWYDAPTNGNFLASGPTFITPPITAPIIYYVQTTVSGCTSARTPVLVNILAKPVVTGATVCQGTSATLSASGGDSYVWYDAPVNGNVVGNGPTFTTPPLLNTTTYYVVSTTNGCVSARTAVVAIVTPPPQAPTAVNVTICSGNVANLHANAPAGIFDWFTVPVGGTSLISSPDYTTPVLTTTTTYYAQTSLNGCVSTRTPVTVTVNAIPSAPTVTTLPACYGTSAALTATAPGGTYQWYDAAAGGTLLFTGGTFNTPALTNSTTYYVQVTSAGGCTSVRTAVPVTVDPPVPTPTASNPLICSGSSVTLTTTGPGGVYQWYDAATGGNLLITGASYTTPALIATTTYYVQTTIGGCTSARTPVIVTVLPITPAPTASNTSVCSGNATSLTATGGSGNYGWYDAATGGNLLSSGQVFVTPALTVTTTYYVQSTSVNGCASSRTPVTVTVNPIPSAPTSTGPSICPGSVATLTATAPSGTIQWYDASVGGNLLASGTTFTTPALGATTTYYVQNTVGTCVSPRTAVTVSIIPVANPQFRYPSGTICTSGGNITPAIFNPSGGTFSAAPAGLVFVSNTTGQINVAASVPGNYVISFAGNGICPRTSVAQIAIVTIPNAQFSYTGPYCQDAANPFPVFPPGASGGVFTASPAGLVFVNTSTGEINLGTSGAGTFTVTNTIAASGACAASIVTATVTINQTVLITAGPDQTIQAGNTAQLAGSITGGITTGKWSGGTGTFSNPTLSNAVYTPGPGETTATLTLTSDDPPGPCGPKSSKVVITINPLPPAPTAAGQAVCPGNSATLSATAPGGAYKWFDAATGGTQLATGPSYTTPPLIVNTTYYVQTTIGGITSTRTPVLVTITAVPAAPTSVGVPVCINNPATLTASGSAGTYAWYDAPVGGNLLSTSNTYVTPPLTVATSYYVESIVNTCVSTRTKVDVTVNPAPNITSSPNGNVCSGNAQNYIITASIPATTFSWSRAIVAGISNPAVTNQTSGTITETLINTGSAAVNVTYIITPAANGCTGQPFNYVVTVNPTPVVTSPPTATVCSGTSVNYTVAFNTPIASFTWSRAAVPGISNAAVSGQAATTIKEVLFNTTNVPVNVTYVFKHATASCAGVPFNLVVTVYPLALVTSAPSGVACSGSPQNYVLASNIATATFSWDRPAVPGISNPAVVGQTSGIINETLINTTTHNIIVTYLVSAVANGCPGPQRNYLVVVSPQPPTPVANGNSPVCINSTIQLKAPTVPNATYMWTGPGAFTSTLQNPNIPNITMANAGVYNLYVIVNGCTSLPSPVTIVVDALPKSVAGPNQKVCHNTTGVQLAGAEPGGTPTGQWSSPPTGSNIFLPSSNQLNAIYVPSAADKAAGSVVLTLTSTSKDDCNFSISTVTITFINVTVNSAPTGQICTGNAQNYQITSATPSVTFTYSRDAVTGISNAAVSNVASNVINETLINTTTAPIDVTYLITPTDNTGCPGTVFKYIVTVNPTPLTPVATVNSPVCVNTPIHLSTPDVPNATYAWTGPNGFASSLQNPDINNVSALSAGVYHLTVTVNGCPSPVASTIPVVVDQPPKAVAAVAGPTQNFCVSVTSIQLAGSVIGGEGTGQWSGGSENFLPSNTDLNAQYIPSAQDKANGSVTLTLTSTGNDGCAINFSTTTITFKPLPAVDAGPDQEVCSQDPSVQLAGKILIAGGGKWSTSGSGKFLPSVTQQTAQYIPSAQDISNGSVILTLLATGAGPCNISTDEMVIKFIPPPTVNAGGTVFVLHGKTITLNPTVSDNNVQYLWTPNKDIDNNTIKNPTITGDVDITYTLTVTDSRGCVSSDKVSVKVSPVVVIPNTFTPNNDGINDLWNIQGLIAYQQATVDVFDRYGQKVFHSLGYPKAWDGTYGGKSLPTGTYYYVIDTKFNGQVLSGSITLIR